MNNAARGVEMQSWRRVALSLCLIHPTAKGVSIALVTMLRRA
jgi:hypothetical protein